MDLYTLLYLKWITNKDLLYSTGNFAQCFVAAWMGRGLGENGYMYMAESLCHSPETITTLLIKIKIQYNQYKMKNLKKKNACSLNGRNTQELHAFAQFPSNYL